MMKGTLVTVMPATGGVIAFLSSVSIGKIIEIAIDKPSAIMAYVQPANRFLMQLLQLGTATPVVTLQTEDFKLYPQAVLCESLGQLTANGEFGETTFKLG